MHYRKFYLLYDFCSRWLQKESCVLGKNGLNHPTGNCLQWPQIGGFRF